MHQKRWVNGFFSSREYAWLHNFILVIGFIISANAYAKEITLTDDLGRAVSINTERHRWISLAPHLTESFLAVGLENRLIAVDAYSPKIDALAHAKRFSGLVPHQPTLFRWSPTLVWVWYTSPASRLLALERQGIAVFYHRPQSLKSIPAFLEQLKPLVQDQARIAIATQHWHAKMEALKAKYHSVRKVRVFHPFSWRPLLSFNRLHWLSDALQICGAVSVTDELKLASPIIKPGYVKEQGTEVVLLADMHETLTAQKLAWQQAVPLLAELPVITIDPDRWHRPGPRFLEALEKVCADIDGVRTSRIQMRPTVN